jgi:very-short-patch-repair endonuclease
VPTLLLNGKAISVEATESRVSSHTSEPFFVKNLENIQGDERDVIFISVGYGKNAEGKMSMGFGPLSSHGGERRLNVLITRAKRRCEVFASITDSDIDMERVISKGVAALQLFLRFARTGRFDILNPETREDGVLAMEEDIAEALRGRGYEVDTHVGVSGAFVDAAVMDNEQRGRYVLGIECDGRSYSSARSARDRDRLRGEALRRQGWRLYRVWSMDWYQRPGEQLERIISAIEVEKQRLRVEGEDLNERVIETAVERDDVSDAPVDDMRKVMMYQEASPKRPSEGADLLDTSVKAVADIVAEIVAVEGPIHEDEIVVRVRAVWGLQRTGPRIQEHVSKAIRAARSTRGIERQGKFLNVPGRSVHLRNRSNVVSRNLRWPEMLAPAEIREGIVDVVRENFGARSDEIIASVLRRMGYTTSSANLRDAVEAVIDKMRAKGTLALHGDLLVLVDAAAN